MKVDLNSEKSNRCPVSLNIESVVELGLKRDLEVPAFLHKCNTKLRGEGEIPEKKN
jgi:hypothetical protein